jgi:hypothetical protein
MYQSAFCNPSLRGTTVIHILPNFPHDILSLIVFILLRISRFYLSSWIYRGIFSDAPIHLHGKAHEADIWDQSLTIDSMDAIAAMDGW